MPIFMDEFNPPQIFYVRFMRVIFVVEVAKWRSAWRKEATKKRSKEREVKSEERKVRSQYPKVVQAKTTIGKHI